MAQRRLSSSMLSLALSVLAAVCVASSSAQQQQQQTPPLPPQPAVVPAMPSCPPVQASLSPCVSYFIGNSSSPPAECCSHMQSMFQSQAPCLCAALAATPAQLGAALGQVLPSACNLPPNACTSSSAPAGGSGAPATVPSGTIPASGGGSKSVPGLPDSAAGGAECMGTSAAIVVASSFLVAYLC